MEGLVCWSNYGGKAAYIHGGQGVLAGQLAGHKVLITDSSETGVHPLTFVHWWHVPFNVFP
jgi:hypothetical protein